MCFIEKPLTEYHTSKRAKDGKQNNCKICQTEYFKKWREVRKESPQSEFPQSKVCSECRVERPISQFGNRSDKKDKKMPTCKDCWRILTKNAVRRLNNKRIKSLGRS